MLVLQNISYRHPDREQLFENIHLSVGKHDKVALIGNNGTGKSTLLKLISGRLAPSSGRVFNEAEPYYVPQHFGQYNQATVAAALGIENKYRSLQAILSGDTSEHHLATLDNDWTIEERCREALALWKLDDVNPNTEMRLLSGGEKTKVFLAAISLHHPELVLLDEPTNHLDSEARQQLYTWIRSTKAAMVVVSHDRELLNLLDPVCELRADGIQVYGGNYTFYREQQQLAAEALQHDIDAREKSLRKATEKKQETMERQQRLDARGRRKQEKAGVAKIMLNTLRNKAENSTSKARQVHDEKIDGIARELKELRTAPPAIGAMQLGVHHSELHRNKILFAATGINVVHDNKRVWKNDLSFEIRSTERIRITGPNGSGKTTLLKLLLGLQQPSQGIVNRNIGKAIYIDQEYSPIDNRLTVYEQAMQYNTDALQEHEIKIRLTRFLFGNDTWNKSCSVLSGGERMRLLLCCLTIPQHAPDAILLDEPTNNLDIQNIEVLSAAMKAYRGCLLVVSHDEAFASELALERRIDMGG